MKGIDILSINQYGSKFSIKDFHEWPKTQALKRLHFHS